MARELLPAGEGALPELARDADGTLSLARLAPREERAAAEVLAQAFCDGPMSRAVVGESSRHRLRSNRHGMSQSLRGARDCGIVLTARQGDRDATRRSAGSLDGVLVALDPGAFPLPPPSLAAQLLSALVQGLGVATRWGELYRELEAVHPLEPLAYLSLLGVLPAQQRRGIGSALLARWLAHVDAAGVDGYLETDLESNVEFYASVGFEVQQDLCVLGTRIWCMRRPRRSGNSA
jgi:ribosomal protein S18 acetylase RimI-like enzyme